MKILQNHIKEVFSKAIAKAFPTIAYEHSPNISKANPSFGDYQWNGAMDIFKQCKDELKLESVSQVTELVSKHLSRDMFEEVIPAKGFVTMKLSSKWVSEELKTLIRNGVKIEWKNDTYKILVDFSSPNIAKDMHVGHLRSTILGESICRVFEFLGYNVLRINHIGDWGTNFGMYIEYLKREHPNYIENFPAISDLTSFYKKARQLMDTDEDFKKCARANVVKLQEREKVSVKAWEIICEISKAEIKKLYDILDITLEDYGESYYVDMIPGVIDELTAKGICKESSGAMCVFTNIDKTPLILRKSDGGYGYDSTDMACIRHRIITLGCKRLIYVTDSGQRSHFDLLFEAARIAGWATDDIVLDHVGFGLIQNEDGKKFKSRSGEPVRLMSLIDEAIERSKTELKMRGAHDDAYIKYASKVLGCASIRYFDLKQNYNTNYKFSYDKMLNPKGNTAIYILYGYARICSIFKKSTLEVDFMNDCDKINLVHPKELTLGKHLLYFPDVISFTTQDLLISRIADYTYNLTEIFTSFYNECKVVGGDEEVSRLLLCKATKSILDMCLYMLGITPLEKL
ncbi:arginyl-tRNA synthetase [Babesia microti strain RI]|uniref:arginine--tRNA ligase n=1 Tax=Babesia microti (strain RI) TaxID=1133968 RepID=A0A1R4ABX6_BABMR|nr:arginyl-tRNA synthetase [Babesia microti strain RI]SJK86480.1 arginyl-tRNA synthetase [Babesia microti strain RI]|eukprot:XP_021338636.1 arginyl-tRNA synthetase [Babesia microti strain RI]